MLLVLAPKFTLIGLTHVSWFDSSGCLLSTIDQKSEVQNMTNSSIPLLVSFNNNDNNNAFTLSGHIFADTYFLGRVTTNQSPNNLQVFLVIRISFY